MCACLGVHVHHGLMVGSLSVHMFPPTVQEMAGYLLLTASVVGCVTTRVVGGPCDVSFQFWAFHFLCHVVFAVSAKHKGSPLNLHVLILCFSFMVLFFHHKLTKVPSENRYVR
jgi:hypothetical protein